MHDFLRRKIVIIAAVFLLLVIAGLSTYFFIKSKQKSLSPSEVLAESNPFNIQTNPFREVESTSLTSKKSSTTPPAKTTSDNSSQASSGNSQNTVSAGPGGCNSDASCSAYCDIPSHINECMDYAEAHNLMSSDDISKARKVASAIATGMNTPGKCSTPTSCKNYCSNDTHILECVGFAVSVGLITPDEAKNINMMGDKIKNGGPGGCKTREECSAYCEQQIHGQECMQFFGPGEGHAPPPPGGPVGSGLPEGQGPAPQVYCNTLESCKSFCADPANAEKCKNVVISDQESGPTIPGNIDALRANLLEVPQEGQECVRNTIGPENYDKIMAGLPPATAINSEMFASCYEFGVQEHDRINTPTSIPDSQTDDVPVVWDETLQTSVPAVQGTSTRASLVDIILHWFGK